MSNVSILKSAIRFASLLALLVVQPWNIGAPASPVRAASAAKPAVLAATIEVNQALGQNSNDYVAGKDAAIVVYLQNGAVTVDPAQQNVVVTRDGATVATLAPQPSAQPTAALVFLCPDRATCGDWQAGNYSFTATVNGDSASLSNIQFQARKPLRILAVPMRVNYGGSVMDVPNDSWKTAGAFAQQMYPVDPGKFKWQLGQALDVSQFDITTDAGQKGVWQALANLQPQDCASSTAGANFYEKIIGFMPQAIVSADGTSVTNGYTYGDPANVVGIIPGMERTVAHEIGHTFGLGDEYNGLGGAFRCAVNPTPPNYVGSDWDNRSNTNFSCVNSTTQPFDDPAGTGVRIIANTAHPFDTRGAGLVTTDRGNFMGNYSDASKAWVSPDAWKQVFGQSAPAAMLRPSLAPYQALEVSGFISRTGEVTLEPWYSYTSTTALAPVTSAYSIQAVDALSNTLTSAGLEVNYNVFDQAPLNNAPFFQDIPFPAGTAAFKIFNNTTLLKVVPVPAHAPLVTITAPTAGLTITKNYTVTWEASDLDGKALTYEVEYNHSGNAADWITLATGLTTTQWTDDFSTLPGGLNQSRIRVTASDGVNATAATSALFNTPARPPEVDMLTPQAGATFTHAHGNILEGYAYDYQDGDLTVDKALVWRSSLVTGTLGTGSFIVVNTLPVGKQVISLSATNSLGLTSVATATITVDLNTRLYQPLILR